MLTVESVRLTFKDADKPFGDMQIPFNDALTFKRYTLTLSSSIKTTAKTNKKHIKTVKSIVVTGNAINELMFIHHLLNSGIKIGSYIQKNLVKVSHEAVYLSNKTIKQTYKLLRIKMTADPAISDRFDVNKCIVSKIALKCIIKKHLKKQLSTHFNVFSAPVPPVCKGVMSDIGLLNIASESDFKKHLKKASAWGFSEWQEFSTEKCFSVPCLCA